VLGLLLAALLAATQLLDKLILQAGYGGMFLKFIAQEFHRSPRKLWVRMVWGAKEPERSENNPL
jgi:hypothetical protein